MHFASLFHPLRWLSPRWKPAPRPADIPSAYEYLYFYSRVLCRPMRILVRCPAGGGPFPILYLLHGSGHDETTYLRLAELERVPTNLLDSMILIMPQGDQGWYLDSRRVRGSHYARYLLELTKACEHRWPVREGRAGRAIGGFSMGGFGAIRLAAKHPDLFCAASSLIGPLDISQWFPTYHRLRALLGPEFAAWERENPRHLVQRLAGVHLWVRTGDGAEDLSQNRAFAVAALEAGVHCDFAVLPGKHDMDFVRRYLPEQVAFHAHIFTLEGSRGG